MATEQQDSLILDEQSRSKLDGIVQKMVDNKESDADIRFVVGDFKQKYGKKQANVVAAPEEAPAPAPSDEVPLVDENGKPAGTSPILKKVGDVTPNEKIAVEVAINADEIARAQPGKDRKIIAKDLFSTEDNVIGKKTELTDELSVQLREQKQKQPSYTAAIQTDKEVKGSRLSYIYNSFLTGVGQMSSAAADWLTDVATKIPGSVAPGISHEEAIKTIREQVEPIIREGLKKKIGADVSSEAEKKYNDEFWTSAFSGLASSVPAMATPYMSGLYLQAYDASIQSINSTEEGKKLPESVKTVFATSVGIAQGYLEKFGIDKIFGKGTTLVSQKLAATVLKDLMSKGEETITKEAFDAAMDVAARKLKYKVLNAGEKIATSSAIEFATGSLQEVATIAAERVVNQSTDKPVFDPLSFGEAVGRTLYAGAQEAVGGLVFGTVAHMLESPTANYIADKVADAKSQDDIDNLVKEITTGPLSPEETDGAIALVKQYVDVIKTIPTDVTNKKEVANMIIERDDLKKSIEAKTSELENTDEAFKGQLKKEIEALQSRVDDINKQMVSDFEEVAKTPIETETAKPEAEKEGSTTNTTSDGKEEIQGEDKTQRQDVLSTSESGAPSSVEASVSSQKTVEPQPTEQSLSKQESVPTPQESVVADKAGSENKSSNGIAKTKADFIASIKDGTVQNMLESGSVTPLEFVEALDKHDLPMPKGYEDIINNLDNSAEEQGYMSDAETERFRNLWNKAQERTGVPLETEQNTGVKSLEAPASENNNQKNEQAKNDTPAEERATDVVINESETALQETEPATGEQRTTQVEKLNDLIDEIDSKIKGFVESYDTEGIVHELPNTEIGKRAKKDTAKYSKELASMLGWEHDADKKGKPDYAHANIAPAGGDVSFILWKPNSDLGVHVWAKYDDMPDGTYKFTGMTWRLTTRKDKYRGLSNNFENNLSTKELAKKIQSAASKENSYDKTPVAQAQDEVSNDAGKRLSEFKQGDVVYRNYNGRYEEYEVVKSNTDLWKLKTPDGAISTWNAANNGGFFLKTNNDETTNVPPVDQGPGQPTPKTKRQARIKKIEDKELDDLWEDFRKSGGKATSGIDPDRLAKAMKIVAKYLELGYHKLAQILEELYARYGESAVREYFDAIKQAYSAVFSTAEDENADKMDESKSIRNFDLDSFISKLKQDESDTNTEQSRQTGNNTTELPEGGATGDVQATEGGGKTNKVRGGKGKAVSGPDAGSDKTGTVPGSSDGTGVGGIYSNSGGTGEKLTNAPINEELGGESKPEPPPEPGEGVIQHNRDGRNFVIPSDYTNTENFNIRKKYDDNIRALEILVELNKDRRQATPEEQNELFKYVGFGGLKEILFDPDKDSQWSTAATPFREKVRKVHDLVNQIDPKNFQEIIKAIKLSVLNAHYTSIPIIRGVYDVLNRAGFTGGRVLEPSAGIGHFFGAMPGFMAKESMFHGIELDTITGTILRNLYQDANIFNGGYQESQFPQNYFDLVVSNIPFGDYKVFDPEFNSSHVAAVRKSQNKIHNYFFVKALESARPNGLVSFITSAGVLDSKDNEFLRKYISENAEFLGAIRLPNNAFKGNANTEVVTDIIFLRKRGEDEKLKQSNEFIQSVPIVASHKSLPGKEYEINVNQYFDKHDDHVIGEFKTGGLYAEDEMTVVAPKDTDVEAAIRDIGKKIFPKKVYTKNVTKVSPKVFTTYKGEGNARSGNLAIVNGEAAIIGGQFVDNPELKALISNEGFDPYRLMAHEYSEEELKPLRDKNIPYQDLFDRQAEVITNKRKKPEVIKDFIKIRDILNELYSAEANDFTEKALSKLRADLNKHYDNFVKKHGFIADKIYHIQDDIDHYSALALERWEDDKYIGKADIFSKRIIDPFHKEISADNPEQALLVSLSETGNVDADRISELLNKPWNEVREQLGDLIFEEPTGGYATRDKYLSGNIRDKLRDAEAAAAVDKRFERNVTALKDILPRDLKATEVQVPIAARWVPTKYYQDFAKFLFDDPHASVTYISSADQYKVDADKSGAEMTSKWGTSRMNAAKILENALHNKYPIIFDYDEDGKAHLNQKETEKAREKFDAVREAFDEWVWKDANRREDLLRQYNDKFNSTVLRKFDGQHLSFEGMNNAIRLQPHQKDAVWMIVQNQGGIIDHIVGAGKTYVMISAAMTLKRMGVARKPMIAALKSTIPQIVESFKYAYPNSKILFPRASDFSPKNRKRMLASIANNDWDCIIISHDNYKMIPQDVTIQSDLLQEEIDALDRDIAELESQGKTVSKQFLKGLEKRKENLYAKLMSLISTPRDIEIKTFQELGIDHLMVDESQHFKNLPFSTKMQNIAGMGSPKGSQKAFNLMVGIRGLHQLHKGDQGVTFLSGTPISNSISEIYLLLKYMRQNYLDKLGIKSFDSWINSFARNSFEVELSVTGGMTTKNRFRDLVNVPELSTMYREIADVRDDSNLTLDKPKGEHNLVNLKKTADQEAFFQALQRFAKSKSASELTSMGVSLKGDWEKAFMLVATNLANKASLDMRLVNPTFADDPDNKTSHASRKIADIYRESNADKGVQLVFSDMGTPKSGNQSLDLFNYMQDYLGTPQDDLNQIFGAGEKKASFKEVYENLKDVLEYTDDQIEQLSQDANDYYTFDIYNDLKKKLVKQGIPENEVAFIHDYDTDVKKQKLFDAAISGKIRVIIGSTQKLGTGVNVQKNLVALHHMDIQWKPADMEQRNGRGIRQGATLAKNKYGNLMRIFYYATELTLDAYRYQLVETKSKFIKDFKSGALGARELDEGSDEMALSEFVSVLSGDPKIKEKAKTEKLVDKLARSRKNFQQDQYDAQDKIKRAEVEISNSDKVIDLYKKDLSVINANTQKNEKGDEIYQLKIGDKVFDKPGEAGTELIAMDKKFSGPIKDGGLAVGQKVKVAEYKGLPLYAERATKQTASQLDYVHTKWYVAAPSGIEYHPVGTEQMYQDPAWAGRFAEESISRIPKSLKQKQESVEKANNDIAVYKESIGKKWPHDEELQQEQEKLRELNKYFEALAKDDNKAPEPPENTGNEDVAEGDDEFASPSEESPSKRGKKKSIDEMIQRLSQQQVGAPGPAEPFSMAERVKQILKDLGVPVAEKYLSKRYAGIFKTRNKKIRVQGLFDVFVAAHEATHFISDKFGIAKQVIADTSRGSHLRKLLTNIYEEFYPGAKRTHALDVRMEEGLAVLIENYFYDPDDIKARYPLLVKEFIEPTGKYYQPMTTQLLDKMNEVVGDYMKLKPWERVGTRIARGDEVKKRDRGFNISQWLTYQFFNRVEPLKRIGKLTGTSESNMDPYVHWFGVDDAGTVAHSWITGSGALIIGRDGNYEFKKGLTMQSAMKMVKGKEKAFSEFLVSRRVVEDHNRLARMHAELDLLMDDLRSDPDNKALIKQAVAQQVKVNNLTDVLNNDDISLQDAATTVATFENEFAKPVAIVDQITRGLIDFMENSGLISAETANEWRSIEGYAPFFRHVNDELSAGPVGTVSSNSQSRLKSTKARSGGKLAIIDPVANITASISETVGKGLENILWNKVYDLAQNNPELGQRFEQITPTPIPNGKGGVSFKEENDPNLLKFFRDGKKIFIKAAPEFVAVAKNLRGVEWDLFVKLLRIPAMTFTRLTTSANPVFMLGNVTIDQLTAAMNTKIGTRPLIDPLSSLYTALKEYLNFVPEDQIEFKKYLAMGGKNQTYANSMTLSPEKEVARLAGDEKSKMEHALHIIDSALSVMELPSNLSEYITRFAEFKRAKAAGKTDAEAMFMAAQVTTPFQVYGNWGGGFGQSWVRSLPFFTATMAGTYKFFKAAKDNPTRFATVAAGIMAAALGAALALMTGGTDEQKRRLMNLSATELSKAVFFPHPNGKSLIRIKVPEVVGSLTGLVYLAVIQEYNGNRIKMKELKDALTSAIPDQFNLASPGKVPLAWAPQTMKPSLQVAFNTKVYPELSPIVPDYVKEKPDSMQYNKYTSEVAKTVGKWLDVSPMLVEYWVKNQFGPVGNWIAFQKAPQSPISRSEENAVLLGRVYNGFYEKKDFLDHQYNQMHYGDFSINEIADVKKNKSMYDNTADLIKYVRTLEERLPDQKLPENIKQKVFDLLIKLDHTDDAMTAVEDVKDLAKSVVSLAKEKNIKLVNKNILDLLDRREKQLLQGGE